MRPSSKDEHAVQRFLPCPKMTLKGSRGRPDDEAIAGAHVKSQLDVKSEPSRVTCCSFHLHIGGGAVSVQSHSAECFINHRVSQSSATTVAELIRISLL